MSEDAFKKSLPWDNQKIMAFKPYYRTEERIDLISTYINLAEKKCFRAEINWIERPEGSEVLPFMQLTPTMSQVLMDTLWDCGVRPTQGKGSAGAMTAVQEHLQDMRKIVFEGGRR